MGASYSSGISQTWWKPNCWLVRAKSIIDIWACGKISIIIDYKLKPFNEAFQGTRIFGLPAMRVPHSTVCVYVAKNQYWPFDNWSPSSIFNSSSHSYTSALPWISLSEFVVIKIDYSCPSWHFSRFLVRLFEVQNRAIWMASKVGPIFNNSSAHYVFTYTCQNPHIPSILSSGWPV